MNLNSLLPLSGWSTFKTTVTDFFLNGLGGDGASGIGMAIMVIGIIMAAISYGVHKFNPSSRLPGPIVTLSVGVVGALVYGGVEKPIQWLLKVRDFIFSVLGV